MVPLRADTARWADGLSQAGKWYMLQHAARSPAFSDADVAVSARLWVRIDQKRPFSEEEAAFSATSLG
ncbi:hypothetical protein CDO73_07615 [Saccharibacillus sp. O23]|uniref:hypothetical protein n=1 Tax=Saccharibacillus sp. O23 TaxID=2009338 RepID=UPI000B4E8162|nr:hypothetical protein [Saccharibacillus sp. O23]OWR31262.1 hypothetical protein CDO73_07615 [Saccharibacillus sp. O23]